MLADALDAPAPGIPVPVSGPDSAWKVCGECPSAGLGVEADADGAVIVAA
jgi:hypothetical protein